MLRLIAAGVLSTTSAAFAAPTTYTFLGLAERSPYGYGQKPTFYPQRVPIVLILDPATPPTSVSGNTASYSYNCTSYPPPTNPNPMVSATIDGRSIGPGCFVTITVESNPSGQSAITVSSGSSEVGSFSLSFLTMSPTAVPNTSIPLKINTLLFQSASFNVQYGDIFVEGDMVTR